ncbi:MAG TPA: alpha-amylase family glycosyl hydrolase [Kiritimatiellia bacterium]|nr:alpha-amylase family glycosyl hydrolase [Kiritimatiellia bacterium]
MLMVVAAQGQSTRPGMGSVPYADAQGTGVTFRVWAPNATAVGVKGTFNGWAVTALTSEGNGHWSRDIAGAAAGQEYKFRINNSFDKRDPRARRVTSTVGNSIIYNPDTFNWGATPIPQPWRNDVVHYQMHIGTFEGGTPARTFDHAITRLDHVQQLGISSIKLMPVAEFPGDHSWGYNPADLFAIESAYGGPDAFKRFVKAAHERGIAVFMDVVHNHYGPTDLDIWRFDGWGSGDFGGIYFYNDSRAYTPWGTTRPDFGRPEIYSFIRDQIMMYVQEYRVGGFRWDSVYNIINTDNGYNQQGHHLLRDINWELSQNYPYVIRGSEDNAFDYNMNFENQWDVGYRWDLHGQVTTSSDANRNMNTVAGLLRNWASHQRVVFSEAHDYIARTHNRSRIPTEIDGSNPDSIWARKRGLLAAGIVMTTPGIPMIFQGQEFHETLAFHDDTPLRWSRTNTYAGIVRSYRDLIHARRNLLGGTQGLKGTGINVHHIDNNNKVIAYIRWDAGGQTDDLLVVANFSATRWTNNTYSIHFPSAGAWYRIYNSDAKAYQADFDGIGADVVQASGSPVAATVNMGMYSLQIFSKTPQSGVPGAATFSPSPINGCVPVTITYAPNDGPLKGVNPPVIFLGVDGWQNVIEQPMTFVNSNSFTYVHQVTEGTHQLNVSFHNGLSGASRIWDNNNGQDWIVPVTGCQITNFASIVITNPLVDISVSNSVSAYTVQGEATLLSGTIFWTNALTGGGGGIAAASNWSIASIPLATGTNLITVSGYGVAPPGGVLATDAASHGVYLDGWQNGDNGGTGFDGWILSTTGPNAGHFRATAANNSRLNIGPDAWGLWANSGNTANAYRPFGFALRSGDTVRVAFENNWIGTTYSAGIALLNDQNEYLVEFYFTGGLSTYRLNDSVLNRDTGISYTDTGLNLAFTLVGTNTYLLRAGSTTLSGTFAARTSGSATRLRAWNFSAGPGEDYNVYVNYLSITNAAGLPPPVSDSVNIVRLGLIAPAFAPRGPVDAVTGVATSFTVSATGDPAAVLALVSSSASGGYAFVPQTGVLTYTPPYDDAGSQTFTFTAANSAGTATQTVSVSVALSAPAAPASLWIDPTNATAATAQWTPAGGAASYRLDVHTSSGFSANAFGPGGAEPFSAIGVGSSSYLTRTWTNNGIAWTAYRARTDQTIDGPAIQLQNAAGAYLVSGVITGGIQELSVLSRRPSGSGTFNIFVNNIKVATNIALSASVITTRVSGINVSGPFTLMISNSGSVRATFDNFAWTNAIHPGGIVVAGYDNREVAGTSQAITGLTAQTAYYVRVRAVNATGESAYSPVASFTTAEADGFTDLNGNGIPDDWEIEHFGRLDAVTAVSDHDGDGMTDIDEYIAGTNPNDPNSRLVLRYDAASSSGNGAVVVYWSSVSGRVYHISRRASLLEAYQIMATGLTATPPLNVYTDHPPEQPSLYYQIGVRLAP